MREQFRKPIRAALFRALAETEAAIGPAARGAFIPANNVFDALATLATLFGAATRSLLIIDPYMDEKALTDFARLAPEGVRINLMADARHVKPGLKPAAQAWISQFGAARPLDVRLAPSRSLHDRAIIVDDTDAWILTQSLNAFAARSPATIARVDAQSAQLKIDAYGDIWRSATPI